MTGQLLLPFVTQLDAEVAEQRRLQAIRNTMRHSLCFLRSMMERYPPTAEEWDIIIGGIRLSRFVGDWECHKCDYDSNDHTLGWVFNTKVCLKDAYKKGYEVQRND